MDSTIPDERARRAYRNELRFRAANERWESGATAVDPAASTMSIMCECARADCSEMLEIAPAAYHEARRDAQVFIVLPGHVLHLSEGIEQVVARHDDYWLVTKDAAIS